MRYLDSRHLSGRPLSRHRSAVLHLLAALALTLLATGSRVRADVSADIDSVTVSNPTVNLIASDATNPAPGFDRDAIHAAAVVDFTKTAGTANLWDYEMRFQLTRVSDSAVIPLKVGAATVNHVTVSDAVNVTGGSVLDQQYAANLVPASDLALWEQYRVRVTLFRRQTSSGAAFADTGVNVSSSVRSWRHFSNTVSNDASYNVIAAVKTVTWDRDWAAYTTADKNTFRVTTGFEAFRYDNYLLPVAVDNVKLRFSVQMRDDNNVVVPLEDNTFDLPIPLPTYVLDGNTGLKTPSALISAINLTFRPQSVLKSVSRSYKVTVSIGVFDTAAAAFPLAANSVERPLKRLLNFTGAIRFGNVNGTFTSLALPGPSDQGVNGNLVRTTLRIDAQSGAINGVNGYTFGDSSPLTVDLDDDGIVRLAAGSVNVTEPPAGQYVSSGNLRYERRNVVLTPAGATADLALLMPSGFGWSASTATRILESEIIFNGTTLNAALGPVNGLLTKNQTFWGAEESKPFWFEANQAQWNVAASRITFVATSGVKFVRRDELLALQSDVSVGPGDRIKKSNDHYFQALQSVTSSTVTIETDSAGTAKLTGEVDFDDGIFRTHFPSDALVSWGGGGTMKITQDAVIPAQSSLNNPDPVQVSYAQDCGGEGCPVQALSPETLSLSGGSAPLRFTRDGGFAFAGTLTAPKKLHWGKIESLNKFAHETSAFSAAAFHMPGIFLLGAQSNLANTERPGFLLHSGVNQAVADSMVRPSTAGFENGTGDYAGLNFRATGAQFTAVSVLAGQSAGPYDLSNRCHYVTRLAGVTGIHEAYTGSFPPGALLYGYQVNFADFGLQFVHSKVTDSRTKGSLVVPAPSDFTIDYEKMFFTCLGAPGACEISAAEAAEEKVLTYWQADFRALNVAFVPMAGAGCDPTNGRLSVGIEAWSSEISTPLNGTFGFLPSGQIQTGADPATEPAITSRLKLPSTFNIKGPEQETWAASTVGDAYFNHAATAPGETGWLNITAKIDLPFFEDAPVHLHTGTKKDDAGALLHLMGGFHDAAKCFSSGGKHFFNSQPFDVAHRGLPSNITPAAYREGSEAPNDKYRMHAQTTWLDVVKLDYPMAWQTGSRTFKDFDEDETKLLVLEVKHRCRILTPENADVDFGAKAGLNKLSLTALASGQISNLLDVLQGQLETETLTKGRKAIEELLEPTMRGLFQVPLETKMDAQAEALLAKVFSAANWDADTKNFIPTLDKNFFEGLLIQDNLLGDFQGVMGLNANVAGVLGEVKARLTTAKTHITAFREYSQAGPGNKFEKIAATAQKVAAKVSQKMDDPVYKDDITALIERARPVLAELDKLAAKAEIVVDTLLNSLNGNGPVMTEMKAAINDVVPTAELDLAVDDVAADIRDLFKPFREGIDNPAHPEARALLRRKIAAAMQDRFYSTGVTGSINRILKQRIYDVEQQMRQVVDGVFEQADIAARDVVETVLGGVDKKFTEFLGDAANVMAGAEAKGKAHIRGDSLTDLRLDVIVEVSVSEKMKAHVFIEIKELNSDNTPGGCLPPGGMGTEVTLGAKEVSLEWAYPGLTVSFDTRFQFDGNGKLTGLGGGIEVLGEIKFGGQFVINELGCAIMIGLQENYFSAEVSLSVGKGFKAKGGVFFGKTCTLAPFFWDESVKEALGEPPFTGAYVYGEVHIAINQLIGIPSTCLFNLKAGVGTGIGYFTEGPTWIGKMYLGVEGEVLCIISVTGEISLVGVRNPEGLNLVGKGRLAAELGWCPICISVERTATMTYKNKKWSKKVN